MPAYLILISLLFAPLLSQAAIYKWTDDQGNIHYTQEKPKTATSLNKLKVNRHAPLDRSTYKRPGSKTKDEPAENKTSEKTTDDKKKKKMSPAKKKRLCSSARRNLATLRAKAQIKQRDKKGNIRFITEKEKQMRIKQAQKFVNKNCR